GRWAYQPSRFNGCSDPDALDEVRIRALTVRLVPLWSRFSTTVRRLVLSNDDMGADRHPVIEISHVVIDQAEAAGRDPDRFRRVGAVEAVHRVAEIHCARSERVARAAGHEARQIGLALDHFRRRMPIWPLGLARDLQQPLPGEAVAADAYAVTHRMRLIFDQIKMQPLGIDNDGARRIL